MLERDARIGGEHTWCHFATDVSPAISEWLGPLIAHDWAGYDVRFPAHRRTLTTHYRAITSARLHQVMSELMGEDAWLGVEALEVKAETRAAGRRAPARRAAGDRRARAAALARAWRWAGRSSSARRCGSMRRMA